MKHAFWLSACLLAAPLVGHAQQRPEPIISPEFGTDHRVTFRIRAPRAGEARVAASVGPQVAKPAGTTKDEPGQWNMPMQKDSAGLWTLTVGPLDPDVYRYNFLLDGVRLLDLANRNVSAGGDVPWSYFEVPSSPPRLDETRDVPHGSVQLRSYTVSGRLAAGMTGAKVRHDIAIYVPPDYDIYPRRKFPVLYLFHGGGDAEEGWVRLGRVPQIEENLLAARKAVPMIVVMPVGDDNGDATRPEAVAAFNREILDDVMPLIEKNYRVRTDREGRAVAGRANGATQAFTLGLRNLDKFAWVAAFSAGAPISSPSFDLNAHVPGLLQDPAATNAKLKLLFLSVGTEDTRYPSEVRLDQALIQAGIRHEFHSLPGEHEWKAWRPMLADLMGELFQPVR
jgi:enterochelin esterase-like enzyme